MIAYKDLESEILQLIDQYSIHGEKISPVYNGQLDYTVRIPALINSSLIDIRTGVAPARAMATLHDGVPSGVGWEQYKFPDDCWRLCTGGVYRLHDGCPLERFTHYHIVGDTLILPEGRYMIEYFRYPVEVPSKPIPTYMIDEDSAVLHAAALYAAAQLVRTEDEFTYSALENEYETRLARLRPPITAELIPVEDVYGGYMSWHG